MPKTAIDYSKTQIYKLIHNDDINNENIYIGSTTNFVKRKSNHKDNCTNEKSASYHLKVYQNIRNNGGWFEWKMLLVENFPCTKKTEADVRERYWFDYYKSQLNTKNPSRTKKEWRNDNKIIISEKAKIHRNTHKIELAKQRKKIYEKNKEEILEKCKKNYEKNKVKILEKKKVKITCDCGCFVRKDGITEHKKTKKHIKLIQQFKE